MKKRILLMNSAMMPQTGAYELRELSAAEFFDAVAGAYRSKEYALISYIGYPQNAALIQEKTGVPIAVSRDTAKLYDGDTILIMRLSYRVNPSDKGREVSTDDFEYFQAKYYAT